MTNTGHHAAAPSHLGPLLYLRGVEEDRVDLTVLLIRPASGAIPALYTDAGEVAGRSIRELDGRRIIQYRFGVSMAANAWYTVDGTRYDIDTAYDGDLRVAFVSCNGQEFGDRGRSLDERNALWQRLAAQHIERPLHLLLHGGDQIYADELLQAHPRLRQWTKSHKGVDAGAGELNEIGSVLQQAFTERYLQLLSQPAVAALMARVPSLAMWDDHDICDGWGSLWAEKLDSLIGRCVFDIAREHFLLFQLGTEPGGIPDSCLDVSGTSLSWRVTLPGLDIVAPDLRSERRPRRVMGVNGWDALERSLTDVKGRVLVLSSVPALGPRLSWIESIMHLTAKLEKYEDDLRDQWQSTAHRQEWRRFLARLAAVHEDPQTPVTIVSGEIHLATRGMLDVTPAPLHQLVASGIAHPPPSGLYARVLGALARFGESPLDGHPISLCPLPGRRGIYTAQRNYLMLERQSAKWHAWWELEHDGATSALPI